jgi:hypothetical protein
MYLILGGGGQLRRLGSGGGFGKRRLSRATSLRCCGFKGLLVRTISEPNYDSADCRSGAFSLADSSGVGSGAAPFQGWSVISNTTLSGP